MLMGSEMEEGTFRADFDPLSTHSLYSIHKSKSLMRREEPLDDFFVLLREKGAGRIDQAGPRTEQFSSPREYRNLQPH